MSGLFDDSLCGGEALDEVASLAFAEDVRVDREDRAGLVAQVLRDFVDGGPETQPRGGGVVPQRVAAKSERELADHPVCELAAIEVPLVRRLGQTRMFCKLAERTSRCRPLLEMVGRISGCSIRTISHTGAFGLALSARVDR